MEYNFVFFDINNEYYNIARYEAECLPNFCVRELNLSFGSSLKKKLFQIHTSPRLNRKIALPLQRLWNRSYIGTLGFSEEKPICFIFTPVICGMAYRMRLFSYLRKKYPDCKLVLLLRDRVQVSQKFFPQIDIKTEAKALFDVVYTINNREADLYGFEKMHSFCSRFPVPTAPDDPKSDVIFIGVVKDRLDTVKRAYEKFTAAGLKCDFLLVQSEPPTAEIPQGICVQKARIPYLEMLRRTVNSRCVLDVTQKDSDGLTSRGLEALCYNKKLLTDNPRIKESKHFDPKFICLYQDIDEVDPEFIREDICVDYGYDGEYSPVRGLEKIEAELKRKERARYD